MKNFEHDIVAFDEKSALFFLEKYGVAILRGMHPKNKLEALFQKTNQKLENPNILINNGYFMKNQYTKYLEGFLIDKMTFSIFLDERILNICEEYINDQVFISDFFVKKDLGKNLLYFDIHTHNLKEETDNQINDKTYKPKSIGFLLYTHDTEEGAFVYAPFSHKYVTEFYGEHLRDYPEKTINDIRPTLRRINGKKGDIILFDHRGFHGPEQPVKVPRTVFIGGYQSAKNFGYKIRIPILIYMSDLACLNERQKNALGLNCKGSILDSDNIHISTSYKKNNKFFYNFLKNLIDIYGNINFYINISKRIISRILRTIKILFYKK